MADEFPYPTGVHCTNLAFKHMPPGYDLSGQWYSAVDPVSCDPYEATLVARANMDDGPHGSWRDAFNKELDNAIACCEARRWYLASAQYRADQWTKKCEEIDILLEAYFGPTLTEWYRLPDTGAWRSYVMARGGFSKPDPEGFKDLILDWQKMNPAWRDWALACKPWLVQGLERIAKLLGAKIDQADPKAAARIADEVTGAAGKKRQRELVARLDQQTREWQSAKTERERRTTPPGNCSWILDELVCVEEEVALPPPPPAPRARNMMLILGAAGALLGGPPGALGGAAVGAFLDRQEGTP